MDDKLFKLSRSRWFKNHSVLPQNKNCFVNCTSLSQLFKEIAYTSHLLQKSEINNKLLWKAVHHTRFRAKEITYFTQQWVCMSFLTGLHLHVKLLNCCINSTSFDIHLGVVWLLRFSWIQFWFQFEYTISKLKERCFYHTNIWIKVT